MIDRAAEIASIDRKQLARRLVRGSLRIGLIANGVGALVVFVALAFVGGVDENVPHDRYMELVALFGAVLVLAIPFPTAFRIRRSRPYLLALEEGRPLVGEAREALFRAPWENVLTSISLWVVAALIFSTHSAVRLGADAEGAAYVGLNILLGGLTTMAIVYLLNERVMRPAFAAAFHDEPPAAVRGVAVGPRLLLAWVLGAGVPLVAIALVFLNAEEVDPGDIAWMRRMTLTFVVIGLAAGAAITVRVARSVADPLGSVRAAMASVKTGNLDVSVEVDDATEVGLLQAGFNEMVDGLRERVLLRDLFGRHVGEEIARHALERGVELGGELREASAVFIDLIGSTSFTASHPPTEVVDMLNDLFRAVVSVTQTEGGLVNKFEGDAALCLFGVPVSDGNHAASALRAARALRREMEQVRGRHPELDAGIGVSTGRVLAGNVGAEHRYEYTVIGDAVNEAARLTDEAKQRDGRVLASEAAIRAAGDAAGRWEAVDVVQLRGRPEPTRVYEPR